MLSSVLSTPVLPSFWSWAYENHYDFLASPLGYSCVIVAVYCLAALPWVFVDYFRLFSRHKIQKDVYFDVKDLLVAFGQYWITELFVYLPLTLAFDKFGLKLEVSEAAPTIGQFAGQMLKAVVTADFTVYLCHYLLHTKFLYKHVHSLHHQYRTPFSFSTQAHHPVEAIMMALVISAPIMYFCTHIMIQWTTLSLIMIHGTTSHSGYDFGLFKAAKGYIGFPAFHDSHHLLTTKNLGAYTTIWDRVFGTYVTPPIYAEKPTSTPDHPAKLSKTPSRQRVSFFGKPASRRVARS